MFNAQPPKQSASLKINFQIYLSRHAHARHKSNVKNDEIEVIE